MRNSLWFINYQWKVFLGDFFPSLFSLVLLSATSILLVISWKWRKEDIGDRTVFLWVHPDPKGLFPQSPYFIVGSGYYTSDHRKTWILTTFLFILGGRQNWISQLPDEKAFKAKAASNTDLNSLAFTCNSSSLFNTSIPLGFFV